MTLRSAARLARLGPRLYHQLERDYYALTLDYDVDFRRRWTEDEPHPELLEMIAKREGIYLGWLERFSALVASMATDLPWSNRWLPPLDAISLYGIIASSTPITYLEIGSGISTRFARQAIRDHSGRTRIVSIDPEPRAEVADLVDVVRRQGLEEVPVAWILDQIRGGDVILLDGSHRCLMNSDVTAFFLEVLPRLPARVMVGIHDVFLPYDYPEHFRGRFYSEQYLLAAILLADQACRYQIELPMAYASSAMPNSCDGILTSIGLYSATRDAGLFWISSADR